jgi:hypothetical protein
VLHIKTCTQYKPLTFRSRPYACAPWPVGQLQLAYCSAVLVQSCAEQGSSALSIMQLFKKKPDVKGQCQHRVQMLMQHTRAEQA